MTRNERLIPWLHAQPNGATFKEINALLGESHRMTRKRLQDLRIKGTIAHTPENPRFLRWHTPEHAETAAKCSAAICAKRKRAAVIARKKRNRLKMRSYRIDAWANATPAQIVLPADIAAPLRVRAAPSVWEWRP